MTAMDTTHLGFIIASYALATLVIFGLIAWVIFDYRSQTARLQKLEAQGAAPPVGSEIVVNEEKSNRLWLVLPLIIFIGLSGVFLYRLAEAKGMLFPRL